ncbi:MAG: ribonuclease HII [Deferribacteraceae bacterium]|jgi:ribonuclease HII|nr:ribonuclease HII [Deferribacteraceae bacterium]
MKIIAGVDEVGRGCLAGPVAACAVALPEDYTNPCIKDSKQLSAKKRGELDKIIRRDALAIGIGLVCNSLIDKIGIAPAVKQAMQIAIASLNVRCDSIIIDAVRLNNLPCPSIHPYKADSTYVCVAAASVVAKVYRDALMDNISLLYPEYGWERNKGYGSKAHTEKIRALGATVLHRRTFINNYV